MLINITSGSFLYVILISHYNTHIQLLKEYFVCYNYLYYRIVKY